MITPAVKRHSGSIPILGVIFLIFVASMAVLNSRIWLAPVSAPERIWWDTPSGYVAESSDPWDKHEWDKPDGYSPSYTELAPSGDPR